MKINKVKALSVLPKVVAFGLVASLFSCSKEADDIGRSDDSTSENAPKGGIQAVLVGESPEGAISITELRKSIKVGDTVVFHGKLIGSQNVLLDGRAMMILGDPEKLTSCDLNPGDSCSSPWDVCCDDHDLIKASIVTVQVVDAKGAPLKTGFRGVGGIKELSNLVIKGVVAEGSNAENVLITAESIFVKK